MLERRVPDVRSRVSELHSRADRLRREVTQNTGQASEEVDRCIQALDDAESGLGQMIDDLQDVTQSYLDLFEISPHAYVVTTTTGIISDVNSSAQVLLQSMRSVLVGMELREVLAQIAPSSFESSYAYGLTAPELEHVTDVKLADNLLARVVRLPDRPNREPRLLWCLQRQADGGRTVETPRQSSPELAQDELVSDRSVAFLRRAIDECLVGIVLVEDLCGDRVYLNHAALRMLGPAEPKLSGLASYGASTFFANGGPHAFSVLCRDRILLGQSVIGENLVVRQNGAQVRWLHLSGTPLRDENDSVAGALIIIDDLTAIHEEQRQRAEWLSMVVHDMRAPLAVISGYAQLIEKHLGSEVSREPHAVLTIQANAARLNRMIADLLDASRIEISQLSLHRRLVDLVSLLNRVVEDTRQTVTNRPIQIVRTEPGYCPVIADPERIEQVLENLLRNAIKYGFPNSTIEVGLEGGPKLARVWVTNAGEEIRQEEARNLFRRFQRTRTARRSKEDGLGLGLYIAQGIVEAHGGRISLESAYGHTTFSFAIPIPIDPNAG